MITAKEQYFSTRIELRRNFRNILRQIRNTYMEKSALWKGPKGKTRTPIPELIAELSIQMNGKKMTKQGSEPILLIGSLPCSYAFSAISLSNP